MTEILRLPPERKKRAKPSVARQRLADSLRRLRRVRGWSQEVLADKAMLNRSYLADVERGTRNISLDNIEKLANAFDMSAAELLTAA